MNHGLADKHRLLMFLAGVIGLHFFLVEMVLSRLTLRGSVRFKILQPDGWHLKSFYDEMAWTSTRPSNFPGMSDYSLPYWQHPSNEWPNMTALNIRYLYLSRRNSGIQYTSGSGENLFPVGLSVRSLETLSKDFISTFGVSTEPQGKLLGNSALRVREQLRHFCLEHNYALPEWTNSQILNPTVVQVLLDSDAAVLAASTLPPGSGFNVADQNALRMPRSLRFRVASTETHPSLSWGLLEFVWHTKLP